MLDKIGAILIAISVTAAGVIATVLWPDMTFTLAITLLIVCAVGFVSGLWLHLRANNVQPRSPRAQGAEVRDGNILAGSGGAGQFWGGGGGGGGGIRVGPHSEIEAGGGGGGGGLSVGGQGGGDLGGGGGGAVGLPPEFLASEPGRKLVRDWGLYQKYKNETGDDGLPPPAWMNAQLRAMGERTVYSIRDGNATWTEPDDEQP